MKPTPTLLAASSLLALLSPAVVRAEDSSILTFELATPQWAEQTETPAIAPELTKADLSNQPLPIPSRAANPPMRYHSPQQLPVGVYRRGVAVALNDRTSATQLLPPAPPLPVAVAVVAATPKVDASPGAPKGDRKDAAAEVLDFALEPSQAVAMARAKLATPKATNPLPDLFKGETNSLVAWAIGSAEGTRTPNGAINPAYFGHTDPGNRAWNMGTFSYQHGAQTPEEADRKQLTRLQNQGEVLRQRASERGLNLTLEETLNGLDLANQSPLAAIGRVGYIERLAEAKADGYQGTEAILRARTRAYINPNTGRWNAPGLGNTEASIRRDQSRRADAVAKAIAAYEAQNPALQPQTWALAPVPEIAALDDTPAEPVDDVLQMWTAPSDSVAEPEPPEDAVLAAEPQPGDDDSLAGLWQVTVERLTQAAIPQGGSTSPQIASLGAVLFSRGNPPAVAPIEAANTLETAQAEDSSEPFNEAKTSVSAVSAPASKPLAIAPPAWATTREGSPSTPTPAVEAVSIPGAFPDSTVYTPAPPATETVEPEVLSNAIAQPAPTAPVFESPPAPATVEPVAEPLAPARETINPAAPPPDPQASTPNPPASDTAIHTAENDTTLGFDKVSIDDLPLGLSPFNTAPAAIDAANASEGAPEADQAPALTPNTATSDSDQ